MFKNRLVGDIGLLDFNLLSNICKMENLDKSLDFIGCDLSGANLSNDDLSGFNFTNANLSNANFTNSVLIGAIFTNANIEGAIFTNSKLEGLYGKFIIRKADGSPIDPEAKYIVLRYDANNHKDGPACRYGISAYAKAIKSYNLQFAEDLLKGMEIEHIKYKDALHNKLID